MYKLLLWEALLFPINIAEDRTKGSSLLFHISSLIQTMGTLELFMVFIAFWYNKPEYIQSSSILYKETYF